MEIQDGEPQDWIALTWPADELRVIVHSQGSGVVLVYPRKQRAEMVERLGRIAASIEELSSDF